MTKIYIILFIYLFEMPKLKEIITLDDVKFWELDQFYVMPKSLISCHLASFSFTPRGCKCDEHGIGVDKVE